MAIQLILPNPINISLQSKLSTIVDYSSTPQNGAWDIIYFSRIDTNGKQVGQIYRLGKVTNIEATTIVGPELLNNNNFLDTSVWDINSNYFSVVNNKIEITTDSESQAFYYIGTEIGDGKICNITVEVDDYVDGQFTVDGFIEAPIYYGNSSNNTLNQGYNKISITDWTRDINDGFPRIYISGVGDANFKISSFSVKEVLPSINQGVPESYVVTVEPDSTAQTPDSGDFIFFGKDNKIGTAGVVGYFAQVEMKNDSHEYAELFSVSSEVTESSK